MKQKPKHHPGIIKTEISVTLDQSLYVISCGNGFTCLGFDVCEKWAMGLSNWLRNTHKQPCPDMSGQIGTVERYEAYLAIQSAAASYARKSGSRCPMHLEPRLIGLEGKRVKVTGIDGVKRFFTIGKSTGWCPAHLEIARRNSSGGPSVYLQDTDKVEVQL